LKKTGGIEKTQNRFIGIGAMIVFIALFVTNDVIEAGKKYRVPILLYSCIQSIRQEMYLTLYVEVKL
jgi:hypothetical protein